jgi:hypothetical protein
LSSKYILISSTLDEGEISLKYAEVLSKFIKKSGKTLDQISEECKNEGVAVHPTYISKLRLGKRSAPSDEISRALALATGGDYSELKLASDYEKAPEEMKKHLERVADIDEVLTRMLKFYSEHLIANKLLDPKDDSDTRVNIIYRVVNEYETLTIEEILVIDATEKGWSSSGIYDASFGVSTKEEIGESYKELLSELLPAFTVEKNKFSLAIQRQLSEFAKSNKVPVRYVTNPNNIISLYTEVNEYKEFKQKLLEFFKEMYTHFVAFEFESPNINSNIKLDLYKWLSSGGINYKEITLTENDKALLLIYTEALLKDRLTQIDNND